MDLVVKVNGERAALAIERFRLNLQQKEDLLNTLGAGQLQSIYKTFDDEGPGWPPLSPNSLRWNKKYTAEGHKLLVNRGLLRNSIHWTVAGNSVTIGTNLFYAPIQQYGWSGTQNVEAHSYSRHVASRDAFGRVKITNKLGNQQTVRRKLSSGVATVQVKGFTRHLTIPPRPFVIFRPEDPA